MEKGFVVTISIANQVSDTLLDSINKLIPQLSGSAKPLTVDQLSNLLNHEGTTLFVAEQGEEIVAMLTLVTFKIPTGTRAWIEDVVVGEDARGKGLAKELVAAALDMARKEGASTVDLTSRPSREAANALYRSMGFLQRETNVYRFELD